MVRVPVLLIVLNLITPVGTGASTAAPSPSTSVAADALTAYWDVVQFYRRGNAREAARQVAAFGHDRLDTALNQLDATIQAAQGAETSRWSVDRVKAAAAFHVDYALQQAEQMPAEQRWHLAVAHRLLDLQYDAHHSGDRHVVAASFRKRCYLWIAWASHAAINYEVLRREVTLLKKDFPADADTFLTAGTVLESLVSQTDATAQSTAPPTRPASRQRLLSDAEAEYRRAVASDPACAEARLRLGRVLFEQGRVDEALRTFGTVENVDDPWVSYLAHLFAGAACESVGRLEDAARHYRQAVDRHPRFAIAHTALSHVLWLSGQRQDAPREAARAATAVADDDDPWWDYPLGQGRLALRLADEIRAEVRQ